MNFYVTTPIYYVNDRPHIGHAYTTTIADVLARYHRLFGDRVFFLTGTDEHGQKVKKAAETRGVTPQEHVDEYVKRFEQAWKEMGISYDYFIRTTFEFHKKVVQDSLAKLYEQGEIYSDDYEGWYSVGDEMFFTGKDLVDGKAPTGREVVKIVEKNYFFRMSKYQQQLIDYIQDNPKFIQPEGKRSEILGFLKQPLQDLCISRPKSRLDWGVELPFDRQYVTYVWFDALLNYVTGIGYGQEDKDQKQFEAFWAEAVHLLGKDILTTHAVYWPTMLMALNIPLPKTIFAHGWWLNDDDGKMSKSSGPIVSHEHVIDLVGLEGLRYFLCREVRFGNDARYSDDILVSRINSELANNLGNLASRTIGLVAKYFKGVPESRQQLDETKELGKIAMATALAVREQIDRLVLDEAIGSVIQLLDRTNQYLDKLEPWRTAKESPEDAAEALYTSLEVLRFVAVLLSPVMPEKMAELAKRIGWSGELKYEDLSSWGLLKAGAEVIKGQPLFPRIERQAVP